MCQISEGHPNCIDFILDIYLRLYNVFLTAQSDCAALYVAVCLKQAILFPVSGAVPEKPSLLWLVERLAEFKTHSLSGKIRLRSQQSISRSSGATQFRKKHFLWWRLWASWHYVHSLTQREKVEPDSYGTNESRKAVFSSSLQIKATHAYLCSCVIP